MDETESDSESDSKQYERQYRGRNERLQSVIDALAERDPAAIRDHGGKSAVADDLGVDRNRIYYVLDRWSHLVKWRRQQNADPLDPGAVKAAYGDDMAALATPVPDGAGSVTVSVDLQLDDAFRAIKMLPSDLGLNLYAQILSRADELPDDIERILQSDSD